MARARKVTKALLVKKLRDLDVRRASQKGRGAFVSSASGLAELNGRLWVAPDDEKHLASFPLTGKGKGTLHRVQPGSLPLRKKARKKVKPDFEALAALPPAKGWPTGAIVAFASGSKGNRSQAVLLPVAADGTPGKPKTIDLKPLFDVLRTRVKDLNIEGLAVLPDRVRLLQRGNNGAGENAIVDLDRSQVFAALEKGAAFDASMIRSVQPVSLGRLEGVKLCFSDAAPLPDGRLVFSAIAEDTTSAYADGACRGAVVGVLGLDGRVSALTPVQDFKIEGVHARPDGKGGVTLLMVSDADDPTQAAPLLEGRLSSVA
jgi:hypothetical protein